MSNIWLGQTLWSLVSSSTTKVVRQVTRPKDFGPLFMSSKPLNFREYPFLIGR